MSWCTIESDPGVFNEMIELFGVKDVKVEEIYALDSMTASNSESYGLIFLFKWVEENDPRPTLDPSSVGNLVFSRQTVQNACATQAILSVLLNNSNQSIDIGENLTNFKSFMIDLDSESRGYAIGNAENIRTVHNSFARAEPFFIEESRTAKGKKEDAYHFVAYLPFEGKVYELDGLKAGPILLGETGNDWLSIAKPAIEERMQRYSTNETHFALLNIRSSKMKKLQEEMQELQSTLDELIASQDESFTETINEMKTQHEILQHQFNEELQEKERQKQENIRRRHNYFPFIMTLLKELSKKGILPRLVDQAKSKVAAATSSSASNSSKVQGK